LLAQSANAFDAAVAGAWVHGVAAELTHGIRGVTLDDVLAKLPDAWRMVEACVLPQYPVLAELPAVA
jgi:NAD(P)H-hydrate repair Nnr-like enzyme with NAD(P)H-hydrate dehydratase domain